MTKPIVTYLMHRYAQPDPRLNLQRTYRWINYLKRACPGVAIAAPWTAYCESLDETEFRAAGILDMRAIIEDLEPRLGIVCGPEMSVGCTHESNVILSRGGHVIDLTDLRLEEPPNPAWAVHQWLGEGIWTAAQRALAIVGQPATWRIQHSAANKACITAQEFPGA